MKEFDHIFDLTNTERVKNHFYNSGIDAAALEQLAPVLSICLQKEFPVLIHTNEPVGHHYPGKTPNTLAQIYGLIKRFPENKIVLATKISQNCPVRRINFTLQVL